MSHLQKKNFPNPNPLDTGYISIGRGKLPWNSCFHLFLMLHVEWIIAPQVTHLIFWWFSQKTHSGLGHMKCLRFCQVLHFLDIWFESIPQILQGNFFLNLYRLKQISLCGHNVKWLMSKSANNILNYLYFANSSFFSMQFLEHIRL